MKLISLAALFIMFTGCANLSGKLTPGTEIIKDPFDGSVIVQQSPVSASKGFGEAWHMLGFSWNQKRPELVYLEPAIHGIKNIFGVEFNADGKLIKAGKGNLFTDFKDGQNLDTSSNRFPVKIEDFEIIANGNDVKMKVIQGSSYTVSSFGKANKNAVVNTKFKDFIKALSELGANIQVPQEESL